MQQPLLNSKEQLNHLYITRALAILGVITVHVSSLPVTAITDPSSTMFVLFNFLNSMARVGTTTFIFLSAFVLFYSYYDRPLNGKMMLKFYQRRFLYILVPYLIASIFYYIIKVYFSYGRTLDGFLANASVTGFLDNLLWGKAFYHLYFVFISVQFYVLFPILLLLFQRFPKLTKHLVWIGIALQWGFILINHYDWHYQQKGSLALSYLSYYFLGAFIGIYYNKIKDWIEITWKNLRSSKMAFWVPLWTVWIGSSLAHGYLWYGTRADILKAHNLVYEGLFYLQTITAALVLLQLSSILYRKLSPKLANVLIHLGVASFGIYIIHAGLLYFYSLIKPSSNPTMYMLYIAGGFIFTLFMSWGIVGFAMKYVKGSWMLFGSQPKKSPYIELTPAPYQTMVNKTEQG